MNEEPTKINLERSRMSRWFGRPERLWAKDLKRLLKMIKNQVEELKKIPNRDSNGWIETAPHLTLAIFGANGTGKSSLLKTLVRGAQKKFADEQEDYRDIASLDILHPTSFAKQDHLLYSVVAAGLQAHKQHLGDTYDYESLTSVLKAYREIADHLRVIHPENFGDDLEPHALAAEVVQRHTSGLVLKEKLDDFFNALANSLTGNSHSVVLLPVDDLDLTPEHLLPGLRQLQAYLLHPRLVPIFCFTDRLAEEIVAGAYASKVQEADQRRNLEGRLGVSEQLAVHFLSKCFPIRNRLRLSTCSAAIQDSDLDGLRGQNQTTEPVLLTLGAASILLFGVPDRNSRHPIAVALRPSRLRRQLHVLDALRGVGVDQLITPSIRKLVGLKPQNAVESDRKQSAEEHDSSDLKSSWGRLFERAAWALMNVHRDILREHGLHLEDLYTYTPHTLRRFLLEILFRLPVNAQTGLWQRWRNSIDSRRSQVISLFAANTYRPWFQGDLPTGEDHQHLLSNRELNDEKHKHSLPANLGLLWFLDLAINFYLPLGRAIHRQIAPGNRPQKDANEKEYFSKEPISGAGWTFHTSPVMAGITADEDFRPFTTGMLFLDPIAYSTALTTLPRIEAIKELNALVMEDQLDQPTPQKAKKQTQKLKMMIIGTPTSQMLTKILESKPGDEKNIFNNPDFKDALLTYIDCADWESGREELSRTIKGTLPPPEKRERPDRQKALKLEEFEELSEASIEKIMKCFENHQYEKVEERFAELEEIHPNLTPKNVEKILKGLKASEESVHDDQLLLRAWTCYGYNRGRFWSAVSLWRGLGLMGQLIENHRRWLSDFVDEYGPEAIKNLNKKDEFICEKIVGVLNTHSLRGLVPGRNLGRQTYEGALDLAFPNWDTPGQRQAIRRLARRLSSWLNHSKNLEIYPLQNGPGPDKDKAPYWSACFLRRLHGSNIVGALWQWLDAENLEYQGQQYDDQNHYRWNAGIALTSWIRVLLQFFERSHEIRWLIETCPLTGPFLSRSQKNPFLSTLRNQTYIETLKVVQHYAMEEPIETAANGDNQPDPKQPPTSETESAEDAAGSAPRIDPANNDENIYPIRLAAHFRPISDKLEQFWNSKEEGHLVAEIFGHSLPQADQGTRRQWLEIADDVMKSILKLEDASGLDFKDRKHEEGVTKIISFSKQVCSHLWKKKQSEGMNPRELEKYRQSLLASFRPKVKWQHKTDEREDLLYSQSACFEIASMIQQFWKVSAHASAASLFYQIPRVRRNRFVAKP